MTVNWPADLVETLAERRGIIFLGAGASSTSSTQSGVKLPTWRCLLQTLASDLSCTERQRFDALLNSGQFPQAAQLIVDYREQIEFQEEMRGIFDDTRYRPSPLYEIVNLLDQPIVMTTNYDRFYERYWEALANDRSEREEETSPLIKKTYKDIGSVDAIRRKSRILFKIHGCVSAPETIVLSKSQYNHAKYQYKNFFDVISALILTRTVLFIGVGFNGDPDVDLLLEDAAFTAQSNSPHYALIPSGRHPSELKSLRSLANIKCLEYDLPTADDHDAALDALHELQQAVQEHRDLTGNV